MKPSRLLLPPFHRTAVNLVQHCKIQFVPTDLTGPQVVRGMPLACSSHSRLPPLNCYWLTATIMPTLEFAPSDSEEAGITLVTYPHSRCIALERLRTAVRNETAAVHIHTAAELADCFKGAA